MYNIFCKIRCLQIINQEYKLVYFCFSDPSCSLPPILFQNEFLSFNLSSECSILSLLQRGEQTKQYVTGRLHQS